MTGSWRRSHGQANSAQSWGCGGLPRFDAAGAKAEENLNGKYLLRTADPGLSAEDIAPATSSCRKLSAAGAT
jgi:hypothetical protein